MAGYYTKPSATEEVGLFGWHHTGDIGDNYLFNVYSGYFHAILENHIGQFFCGSSSAQYDVV
jgi:acyl-CoA synthetase (AMP-forming)/AMP-acid ligase II